MIALQAGRGGVPSAEENDDGCWLLEAAGKITIEYLNLKGEKIVEHLEGHRARVVMHENDHLNGVLHIDRMAPRERKKILAQLQEIKRKYSKS